MGRDLFRRHRRWKENGKTRCYMKEIYALLLGETEHGLGQLALLFGGYENGLGSNDVTEMGMI